MMFFHLVMVVVSAPKKRMTASKARPKSPYDPRAKPLTKEEKRSQYFHKTKPAARMTATTEAILSPTTS